MIAPAQDRTPVATVLVVDASAGDRVLARQVLRRRGRGAYRVLEAGDLPAALSLLEEQPVDIVIIETELSEDGADDLAQVQAAAPTASVILREPLWPRAEPPATLPRGVLGVVPKRDVDALWRLVEFVAPPWW